MPEEEEPSITSRSLGQRIRSVYESFSALQQQKLMMATYVRERQPEIDDSLTAAASILKARYAHIEPDKIMRVLTLLEPVVALVESNAPAEQFTDSLEESLSECRQIIPDNYSTAFAGELMNQAWNRSKSGNSSDFRASIFTSLVADFEAFMVGLMTELYNAEPRKLRSQSRSISWEVLLSIDDLVGFREQCVEDSVVDIMRGSIVEWMAALKKDHGVDATEFAEDSVVNEMFQRRHVLVHNGGLASRLYIQKCVGTTVTHREHLDVSEEYLTAAADLLAVIALTVTVKALLKMPDCEPSKIELLMTDWLYELLLQRRYSAVHQYARTIPFDRMVNQTAIEITRVNLWLARKRLDQLEAIRAEVSGWQVGHLGQQFQLAKLALLDKLEPASKICDQMRQSKTLYLKHWMEWPLLEEVRMYDALRKESRGQDSASDSIA